MLKPLALTLIISFLAVTNTLRIKPRIVNGFSSEAGQFPFFVFIGLVMNDTESGIPESELSVRSCGGSILNEQWILTAAHCLVDVHKMAIYFGSSKLEDSNEKTRIIIVVDPKNVYLHPQFYRPSLYNDIALIRLDEPITFSEFIQPIKLADNSETDLIDSRVIAIGNGYMSETDEIAPILQWAPLTVISLNACRQIFPFVGSRTSVFCAGNLDEKSVCRGDSGGPVISKSTGDLVGLTSFIRLDCNVKSPQGFTRITSYNIWIASVIGSDMTNAHCTKL